MSKRGFGSSSGTYNVRASELARRRAGAAAATSAGSSSAGLDKNILYCTVAFLDETKHTFQLHKKAKGQALMELVFQHLEIIEKDYFGLQFPESISSADGAQWLDPVKSVRKQMKRGQPYLLCFRVKFYVSDPSKLQEEYTRYHFFLQLKKDIAEGRLYVPQSAAALLASYTVQSELGDYNAEDHGHRYLADYRFVPNQTEELERKVMELHKLHRGQTPADAEFNYLDHAKRLDMYGVDLHPARVRDSTNAEIQLGVMSVGLVVFQNHIRINTFSWAKIVKISFKRKQFFIQLRREAHESYDSLLGFNMLGYRSCKNLWKSCVEHHTFFRLHVPRPTVKKYLFVFGSKFRYSGRTEYQTMEEGKRRARLEKAFVRSPSRRHVSRQTVPALTVASAAEEKKYGSPTIMATPTATTTVQPSLVTKLPSQPLPQKPALARLNGTGAHIRHYDSFNNRVVSSTSKEPRKAWTADGDQSDDEGGFLIPSSREPAAAFAPLLPARIGYVDDDDVADEAEDELPPAYSVTEPGRGVLLTNGQSGVAAAAAAANGVEESVVVICMTPDDQGKFGFNVKGGADQNMPIIVSRVAPNTPADRSIPRLCEGDQVVAINGRDVALLAHDTVVQLIRNCCSSSTRELVLVVKPNVYSITTEDEPTFRYVPDILSHVASHVCTVDALTESMLLLGEGLDSGAVVAQYEQLYRKKPNMMMNVARLPVNTAKNRYRDISPYDSTRVVLRNSANGDYVNASYVQTDIPTSGIVNRYIATQGPLPNTLIDFWQMVWEQQSTLIVMLTTVMERGRIKCHQYWPELYQSHAYGRFRVTCRKDNAAASFTFREFTVSNIETNEERHVTHMQYNAWPDHGVPDDSSDFLEFVDKVRHNRLAMVEPTVVHCSAGIGRTGVLILMETAMCLIEANEPVYPLDIVRSMRDQRAMLIQNASQYRFVCEAVLKVYNEKIVKPLPEYHR